MNHPNRILYCILVLLMISLTNPLSASAKSDDAQGVPAESDSIQFFRGLAVSYDIAGTIMRMVSDYGQYEAALRCNLKDRYFPILELGIGSASHSDDVVTGISAKTTAPYGRIGCDFNIAKNKHDNYRVMIGARYAFTSFKQEAEGNIPDPYWGGKVPYTVNTSCNYHWMELLFSVDAKIAGPVRLGWSFRYRKKLSASDTGDANLWYVPGYGKEGNVLGGTFNVTLELGKKNRKL